MKKLYELMQQSVITQFVLATMTGGTLCYMFITEKPTPATLTAIFGIIVGFYFGSKKMRE